MDHLFEMHRRPVFVIGFSLPFAYLLSFVFEGQVLYGLLAYHNQSFSGYIFPAILGHFAGLLSCGLFVKSFGAARKMMISGMGICLLATLPFFSIPTSLWIGGLFVAAYAGGCYLAAWGYYLKEFIPKNERLQVCADVLIGSNIVMIGIQVITLYSSIHVGLILSVFCLVAGMLFLGRLPLVVRSGVSSPEPMVKRVSSNVRNTLSMLCLFIFVITINSGLMYQVINPAFEHLTTLVKWYWAIPYIVAIAIMRNLLKQANRSYSLYFGLLMIMATFVSFMLLGRGTTDYFVINTLMLGACGIFDLFWWSILAEMLEYAHNPAKVFGAGLSANVFGILMGGILGYRAIFFQFTNAEITVIALSVLCLTMVLLPPLNRRLFLLLSNHAYIANYENLDRPQKADVLRKHIPLEALTGREQEVLELILSGRPNREIAATLGIAESTVKTHVGNIFGKYGVVSRAELISMLLKSQGA